MFQNHVPVSLYTPVHQCEQGLQQVSWILQKRVSRMSPNEFYC